MDRGAIATNAPRSATNRAPRPWWDGSNDPCAAHPYPLGGRGDVISRRTAYREAWEGMEATQSFIRLASCSVAMRQRCGSATGGARPRVARRRGDGWRGFRSATRHAKPRHKVLPAYAAAADRLGRPECCGADLFLCAPVRRVATRSAPASSSLALSFGAHHGRNRPRNTRR